LSFSDNEVPALELSGTKIEKFTAVPLFFDFNARPNIPFQLTSDIVVDSLKGRLSTNNFMVWDKFVAERTIEFFTQMDSALVHRFYSSPGTGQKEEESKDRLHKIFVCLRMIRPTRTPFAVVQFKLKDDHQPDVFSFIEADDPVSLILPESEVLNHFNGNDLVKLRDLLPKFFAVDSATDTEYVRRAIRYYETGYSELHDPVLQFTVWMMGIESLFSGSENVHEPLAVQNRIKDAIGSEDIYRDFADRDLYHAETVLVSDIVKDLFTMRNHLVHGGWVPNEWINRKMRDSISGPAVNYADVLREAASFILRAGILKVVNERI
jgi:hypothetical protein